MKIKLITCSFLTLLLANSAFAKETNVPFIHKLVPAEGLYIKYDMSGKYAQKVACVFENFYKGYLKYTENNIEKDSGIAFGGGDDGDEFYFTSNGSKWENTQGLDSLDQYHVDAKGHVWVNSLDQSTKAFATCFYVPEDSK